MSCPLTKPLTTRKVARARRFVSIRRPWKDEVKLLSAKSLHSSRRASSLRRKRAGPSISFSRSMSSVPAGTALPRESNQATTSSTDQSLSFLLNFAIFCTDGFTVERMRANRRSRALRMLCRVGLCVRNRAARCGGWRDDKHTIPKSDATEVTLKEILDSFSGGGAILILQPKSVTITSQKSESG